MDNGLERLTEVLGQLLSLQKVSELKRDELWPIKYSFLQKYSRDRWDRGVPPSSSHVQTHFVNLLQREMGILFLFEMSKLIGSLLLEELWLWVSHCNWILVWKLMIFGNQHIHNEIDLSTGQSKVSCSADRSFLLTSWGSQKQTLANSLGPRCQFGYKQPARIWLGFVSPSPCLQVISFGFLEMSLGL